MASTQRKKADDGKKHDVNRENDQEQVHGVGETELARQVARPILDDGKTQAVPEIIEKKDRPTDEIVKKENGGEEQQKQQRDDEGEFRSNKRHLEQVDQPDDPETQPPLPPGPPPPSAERARPDDLGWHENDAPPLPAGPPPANAQRASIGKWVKIWQPDTSKYVFYNPATKQKRDSDPHAVIVRQDQSAANLLASYDPKLPQPIRSSSTSYAARGFFNRFTGKWQSAADDGNVDLGQIDFDKPPGEILPFTGFSDSQKSGRQMSAYFDVNDPANQHNGRSLKAERQQQQQRISKKQIEQFKRQKQERKERNKRAWLLTD
ncbi:hypothetical protein V1514DRAFT_341156 [Lipomyces japonicus]|uniref:uncharacterized protein n=1 Tax=Lipomyces japonicus TaxID=56871 RepID=UPI0034CEDC13